ncbi:Polyphosphate kinase [Pseudopedobacter saltans DSM 12145]|uniref:Polyphosphate kinase n=1 Tax=Pseudopedobacter saltans (strain ATCC 51119 / DSM 12145 / JCM 21818 / CCUG 39354 / LMG 10337 / NBRC 100064 / NCIMB 13643) TaxID=762903 RepID=F0SDK6_PSESL|nr:polyphosphate kinase 1 [Pseudopedobacter saltans]ADY50733.1 Polyphosphate kinase [Pseudopedobacter saltans DSM 12145]
MSDNKAPLLNREISWLYFNNRVLQEAADKTVPLIERIRFLAIFSSNLDEFYRVRVATLNRLADISSRTKEELGYNPKRILKEIKRIVVKHEQKFNTLYTEIITELAENRIFILNEKQLNVSRGAFVRDFFREKILSAIVPLILTEKLPFPELKEQYLYFFIRISKVGSKSKYALIEVPKSLNRFLVLPDTNALKFIILIDDIIRYNLEDIFFSFEYDQIECYGIQVTRDAEFELDNKVSDKFVEALSKSLQKRKKGKPMRLLYDSEMPQDMLDIIIRQLNLKAESLIPGNRYQNFRDFIKFPNVGRSDLEYETLPSLPVFGLSYNSGIIERVKKRDFLVNLPYQSFDYIIHFLREAAIDPKVTEIQITLYRLAENSKIINALINASRNGKRVYCLVELQARFDEEANIFWARRLEEEGVNVSYGIPDYKVHSKICLVTRIEKGQKVYYATLSTGNFNESSAKVYGDHSLFTANKKITLELSQLFKAIESNKLSGGYKNLIVSPFETRDKFFKLIDAEIANAKKGKLAYMILKMNSLDDERTILKLYEASNASVKIKLIIRGMCSLVPKVKGFSENIEVISILDRFLEHARIWVFGNGGMEKVYLLSADLMTRNLDRRIEVGFPVYDEEIKEEIRDIIDIQLSDNTKAREINSLNNNRYKRNRSKLKVRSQQDTYKYLKAKHSH